IARALVERLDAAETADVHLAGFSMGGYVALAMLRLFPGRVRSLALVCSRAGADGEEAREGRVALSAAIRERGVEAAADAMMPKMFTDAVPEWLRDGARQWMLEQSPETLIADLMAMRERPDSTPMLADLRLPLLVVAGREDTIFPVAEAQQVAAGAPAARLEVIEGASHLAPLEQAERVNAALRGFLPKDD
ncbi:MAG: alpha/beta fold hydrolase, partial [Candidatus Dormibacteria bacterium]